MLRSSIKSSGSNTSTTPYLGKKFHEKGKNNKQVNSGSTEITTTQSGEDNGARQLQMFEKGNKRNRKRQPVEDDSSDDEESGQLVCNMNGSSWESLSFPVIVDSGACASVMPTGWCDHVPLDG